MGTVLQLQILELRKLAGKILTHVSKKTEINNDFGVFDDPNFFYAQHGSNLKGVKAVLYKYVVKKLMNSNVSRIRLAKNHITIHINQ